MEMCVISEVLYCTRPSKQNPSAQNTTVTSVCVVKETSSCSVLTITFLHTMTPNENKVETLSIFDVVALSYQTDGQREVRSICRLAMFRTSPGL